MDLIIKNVAAKDLKFLNELAERLGLSTAQLTAEEKEDMLLGKAIEEGLKSGFSDEETFRKTLRKIQNRT